MKPFDFRRGYFVLINIFVNLTAKAGVLKPVRRIIYEEYSLLAG